MYMCMLSVVWKRVWRYIVLLMTYQIWSYVICTHRNVISECQQCTCVWVDVHIMCRYMCTCTVCRLQYQCYVEPACSSHPLSPSPCLSSLPLLAELTQQELDVIPVTQSTYMQKNKLKFLLGKVDQLLGITQEQRNWSIKGKKISNIQQPFHSVLV